MKNLKEIISEKLTINKDIKLQSIFLKFPKLKKDFIYDLDVDAVKHEIEEYFEDSDVYESKQKRQLNKLISLIPKETKFAEIDEDTGWEINDYIREEEVEDSYAVIGPDNNPTATLYNIKDDLIIQIVDDELQDILTYVSNTNIKIHD